MKQSYHHHNLKEALIEEAIAFLEKQPYESITIRGLTNLLKVSRTAVYRHFSSKEELFQAVILRGFERLKEKIEKVYKNPSLTIEEKIAKIGESYIAYALDFPELYRLMFGDKLKQLREESCEIQNSDNQCAFDILVALVVDAQKENIFVEVNPMEQAVAIWALIHGQASLLIDGHPMILEQKERLIKTGLSMIMKGFKPTSTLT